MIEKMKMFNTQILVNNQEHLSKLLTIKTNRLFHRVLISSKNITLCPFKALTGKLFISTEIKFFC